MILPRVRSWRSSADDSAGVPPGLCSPTFCRRSIDEYAELDGACTAGRCEIGAQRGSWGTEFQDELQKSGISNLRALRAALGGFVSRGPCHASGDRSRKSGGKVLAGWADMRAGQG